MPDKKITALTAATSLSSDDLFVVVDDPGGTPTNKKITAANLAASLPATLITGQTAETTVDDADVLLIYDASAGALRKMTKANLVAGLGGGGGAGGQTIFFPLLSLSSGSQTYVGAPTHDTWLTGLGNEGARQILIGRAGTLGNLQVKYSGSPLSDIESITATVRKNGADSALTLTIAPESATGLYGNTGDSVAVAAGDLVCLTVAKVQNDGVQNVHVSFDFTPD